jgi:hypothetical protein
MDGRWGCCQSGRAGDECGGSTDVLEGKIYKRRAKQGAALWPPQKAGRKRESGYPTARQHSSEQGGKRFPARCSWGRRLLPVPNGDYAIMIRRWLGLFSG